MILDFLTALAGGAFTMGAGIGSGLRGNMERQAYAKCGFDLKRQHELQMMVDYNRDEFERLCGRKVNRQDAFDVLACIKEISKKEGWRYKPVYNINGL